MNFNEYQKGAWTTAHYPNAGKNYVYATLGLTGEAGELANKVKKVARDHDGVMTDEVKDLIAAEMGDLLWYIAALSTELGLDMETVAKDNLAKISDRALHGTLHGTGDDR